MHPPPPNYHPKPTFLILFNTKECPQSISMAKVHFGAIFKMAASENRMYLILICNFTERQSWCLNNLFKVQKYNGNIIWPIVAFGFNGYFSFFFKMAATENTIKYRTLLVIDLYKHTWCQNIHFEGAEIQWRCS